MILYTHISVGFDEQDVKPHPFA